MHRFITSEHIKNNKKNKLFNTVYFELRTRCNGSCSFCAASIQNDTREDITMSFELFKKVINELSQINFEGTIAFHNNSEPLLVKDLDKFIQYTREKLDKVWIQILSNGKSLNVINGEKIIEAGINELSLNIYNDDLNAELPNNVQKFENEILRKKFSENEILTGHRLSGEKIPKSNKKYIKYNVRKRLLNEVLNNRAGSAPNKKTNKPLKQELGFCEFPFEQFIITANGNVSQCCCDFYFSNPMGNIKSQGLQEIWNGDKFTTLRKQLLDSDRKQSKLCEKCDFYGVNHSPKNYLKKGLYYLFKHS